MDDSSLTFPPPSSPRDDEARLLLTAILLLVLLIIIGCVVACVVASLSLRARQTWRNSKERRRLTKRVAWLRDLLQLLPPVAPAPESSGEEKFKGGAGASVGSATAAQQAAVRTVLVRRIEATVSEADRLAASASMSVKRCCCLLGFARSYEVARRLERANKDVDEVYTHLLPVVTQIDATHRVEHVLVGVMQQRQQLRDRNNHSDAQRHTRRPNGSNKLDWQPLLPENNDDQASTGTAAFEIKVDR